MDKEFGTRYLDELIHLAEIEARETPKEEEKPVETAKVEAPKADPVSSAPVAGRRVAAPAPKNDEPEDPRIASLLEHGYKNAGKLTEENLDLIEYVDDSGEIVWVEGVGDLFECEACNTKTPGSVSHCPKCGAFFG